jgi:Uncharacterised protein family (UPF0175)
MTGKSATLRNTLTIELPLSARVPEPLRDAQYVRYVLAGTLYSRGMISGRHARSLTGDDRRAFEENMAKYGFPLMPDDEESVVQELNARV